ncbi:ATP-binding protein [Pontibacter rugosus]|uniref:ATP-binding protein n=1 Tax=Pontibacter rugosus TaxID=1745966 RepID=A0ABW3SW55_9BACT
MKQKLFEARSDLRIGKIIEVNGSAIRIELDVKITELTRSVDGKVYPVGQIGSIIKVHFGRKILFAYVRMLRMRSDIIAEEGSTPITPDDDTRVLEADLFGQGLWSNKDCKLSFTRGVETYPLPLQGAFLCLNGELEAVYQAAEQFSNKNSVSPLVPIGHYIGGNNAVCRANIDKLFGHHCAILGSTGSGKSGTVASILHSVLEHTHEGTTINPRIVIIDPHGEYATAFAGKAKVYRAYNEAATANRDVEQLKLPYWLMSSDELRSLFIGKTEFEATSQNNIIYQAITYARMLHCGLVENVGDEPFGEAKDDVPSAGITLNQILNFDRDKPVPFLISELVKHIDKVQGRKPQKTENLAVTAREKMDSILKKLKVLRSNPQLSFIMDEYAEGAASLDSILSQFVGGSDGKNLRIIDISGLPNEVAGPLTALIARLLFQYKLWQTREERKSDPVLFVCEEAHRYVPNHGEAQYKEAQEAVRRIAKEGRKYGLGLMLVSQRPSDVEATVLSQCNSWLILRLTNSNDQEHVSKFLPDSISGLTKMLSSLTRREAIFVGEAAALPSRIRINSLTKEKLPDSHDISFVEGWLNAQDCTEALQNVANRWVGQHAN